MNNIVYCGVKLTTEYSYYRFKLGDHPSVVSDPSKYTIEVTYSDGMTSAELCRLLKLECIHDQPLVPTSPVDRYVKFSPVFIDLNGVKLRKITEEPHILSIVLVDDHESRVVQKYNRTTMVINTKDNEDPEFIKYVFNGLKYLTPVSAISTDYKFYNYPKLLINDKSLVLNSTNDYVNKLRSQHDVYLIKAIDYEHEFFLRLSQIAESFGIELTRINREETLSSTSYISYSFNQTPVKYVHVRSKVYQNSVMCHTVPIDFQFRTPDMVMYFDFKNRYNNVDLFTNFTEYYTKDKYGNDWLAAVKWSPITEEFNQMYSTDDNSNFSHQCNFRAELYFYEVYDTSYDYIKEIIVELGSS